MRLKTFTAPSAAEAMQLVKNTLGEEAVILSNRQDTHKNLVVVTAAIDESAIPTAASVKKRSLQNTLPEQEDTKSENNISSVVDILKKHGCPDNLLHHLLHKMQDDDLSTALAKVFAYGTPTFERPLLLVGPHGAGKTICTARLAMQLMVSNEALPVYSTDTIKAGGLQQLASLLKVMQLPLKASKNIRETLKITHFEPCLVDTAGLHPFIEEEAETLAALPKRYCDIALVLPAGLDPTEAIELCHAYQQHAQPQYIIFTKLDQCRRLGSVLAAAEASGAQLAYASQSGGAGKAFVPLNPQSLNQLLYRNEI